MMRQTIMTEPTAVPEAGQAPASGAPGLRCGRCASGGVERSVTARCTFCSLGLCSEHLAEALQADYGRAGRGCRHVYVASGWLTAALRGRAA